MHVGEVDEVLVAPARLAIVATLADGRRRTFTELREETGLADGNLHVQAGRLADAGYVAADKARRGRRAVTTFGLTDDGRRAFREQVRLLSRRVPQESAEARPAGRPSDVASRQAYRVW